MPKTTTKGRPAEPARRPSSLVGIETPVYGGTCVGKIAQGLSDALTAAGVQVGAIGSPDVRGFGAPQPAPEGCDTVFSLAEPWAWRPQNGQRFIGIVHSPIERIPDSWDIPLRVASAVFAPSKWSQQAIGKGQVLPFGVDAALMYAPKTEGRRFRVLFSADDASDPRCGLHQAIEAFKTAFLDRDDVELVIRSFERSVDKNDHRIRLQFGKMTPVETAKLYRSADVLLYPSQCEAFPLEAVEALACGTPVIHSGQTGMAEIADLGIKTLSRPMQTASATWHECYPEELAARLREIAARPDAAHELGRRDSEVIASRFRWNIDPLLAVL